ncbi:MAG: hypothetical protein K0S71_1403 [Clostridia bacterium]|jgi:hypothetical protein|nr:hypothetical protein [Clostridia bacterium]
MMYHTICNGDCSTCEYQIDTNSDWVWSCMLELPIITEN